MATQTTPNTHLVTTNFDKDGETRRESGRVHFTQVLTLMLKETSHPEMAQLADWACNETGNLHTSQISHLRNAKMRMLGVKSVDALGRINCAAWAFKNDRKGLFKEMGTAQTTAKIEAILEKFEPVLHPMWGEPLNAGDLMMLYLGYIRLDILGATDDVESLDAVAAKIGDWVTDLIDEKGMKFREGIALLKDNWKGSDSARDRFLQVLAGMDEYNPEQLGLDLPSICEVVSVLADEEISVKSLTEMVGA